MPLADFPGRRGWGYDGVLPFAPDAAYGRPEDLKRLVQAWRGLMVFIDVVCNHFGPEGNYLHLYAPQFFTDRHHTRGGQPSTSMDPIAASSGIFSYTTRYTGSKNFRSMACASTPSTPSTTSRIDILTELASAVERGPGRERHVHLVLENDLNNARLLARDADGRPRTTSPNGMTTSITLSMFFTGEADGYYADFSRDPVKLIGRCLTEDTPIRASLRHFAAANARGEPAEACPSRRSCRISQTTTRWVTAPSANG